jgi:hypothetical protein
LCWVQLAAPPLPFALPARTALDSWRSRASLLRGAGGDLAAAAAAAFGPVSAFDFAGQGTFAEDKNDDVDMLDFISLEMFSVSTISGR